MKYQNFMEIQNIVTNIAVTITVDTHTRADPKNKQDRIILKNEIQYAKKRLLAEYEKREVWPIIEKLEKIEKEIDHDHNTNGLVIFVSDDFSDYIRLPFSPENKVEIDEKFATRELVRAANQSSHYYILCLSLTEIRLIEAYNDTLLAEYEDDIFPFENNEFYTKDRLKNSFSDTNEKYLKEFFGVADKRFHEYYKNNPLPVILAGTEKNIAYFKEKTSNPTNVIGSVRGNFDRKDGVSLHELVKMANVVVKDVEEKRYLNALEEIEVAEGANRLLTDLVQIYKASKEGRIKKIFVEKDYYQSVVIKENGEITLVDSPYGEDVVDDIINDFIYITLQLGGDVVFLPPHYMGEHTKIAAIVRW